jgi:exopolysaccharide biosynthesis polyprenyl glycosylphosphotransferase
MPESSPNTDTLEKIRKDSVPEKEDKFQISAQDLKPSSFKEEGISGIVHRTRKNDGSIPLRPLRITWYQNILTGIQLVADISTVVLSFLIGYWAWNIIGPNFTPGFYHPAGFSQYYFSLGIALISCIIGFEVNGLYNPYRSILNIREFEVILKTCVVGCAVTLCILFLAEEHFFSRGVFGITWSSMIFLMFLQRYAFFRFQNYLRSCGFAETTALIYGAGIVGTRLQDKLRQSPKLGYHVAGFIDDNSRLHNEFISDTPVLGGFSELKNIIKETGAKKLFIALSQVPQKVVEDILKICKSTDCEFQIVPSLYDIVIQRVKLSEVDGIPLIGVSEPRYSFRTVIAKRIFDFCAACLLLVILSPLILLIALGIKLNSKGPVLFRQKRIGKNGKKFVFFKFRSMYVKSRIYAKTPSSHTDSRIFPFGKFLRRTSLDELPQLINVIKGDMSLVGPRPEMPFIVEKYNEFHRQRLNVRPGITGLWQISADRKLAIHENMDYDLYYINNQSFLLDMVILIRTAFSVLKGIGAY